MSDIPFSRRFSVRRAVPISIREDAPQGLRTFVLEAIRHFYDNDDSAMNIIYVALGKIPPRLSSSYGNRSNYWGWSRDAINEAPWYKVYDLIEQFYRKTRGYTIVDTDDFRILVNTYFEENGYAFRLTEAGNLEYRGDETFELAVATASMALSDAGLITAKAELRKAIEDLAKRPAADLTGAVQHAMAGLECAVKQIAGESKGELGKIAKSRADLFPPPLGDVVGQLYGYASNNGRHLIEGGEPDFSEVEFIVGLASVTATYLARKAA